MDERAAENVAAGDELDDAVLADERDDVVGADVETTLPSPSVASEETVDEPEDLLHDRVLPNLVLALELRAKSARSYQHRRTSSLWVDPSVARTPMTLGAERPERVMKLVSYCWMHGS